jgi:hypothetical protein
MLTKQSRDTLSLDVIAKHKARCLSCTAIIGVLGRYMMIWQKSA